MHPALERQTVKVARVHSESHGSSFRIRCWDILEKIKKRNTTCIRLVIKCIKYINIRERACLPDLMGCELGSTSDSLA